MNKQFNLIGCLSVILTLCALIFICNFIYARFINPERWTLFVYPTLEIIGNGTKFNETYSTLEECEAVASFVSEQDRVAYECGNRCREIGYGMTVCDMRCGRDYSGVRCTTL